MSKNPVAKRPVSNKVSTVGDQHTNGQLHDFVLDTVELFTFEFEREPTIDIEEDVEHLIFFEVKKGSHFGNKNIYFFDIKVGKRKDEVVGASVAASYFIVVQTPRESDVISDSQIKSIANLSIWPMYCHEFRSVISKTTLNFPNLPSTPPAIAIVSLNVESTILGS